MTLTQLTFNYSRYYISLFFIYNTNMYTCKYKTNTNTLCTQYYKVYAQTEVGHFLI